jgi:hypothetical protein
MAQTAEQNRQFHRQFEGKSPKEGKSLFFVTFLF